MYKQTLFALLATGLLIGVAGCGDDGTADPIVGDLQVTYRVGSGSSNCQDVGIRFVRVYIGISETEDLRDLIIPCDSDAQFATFADVPVGTYTIRALGLDSASRAIYRGQAGAPTIVLADRTNGPVDLVLDEIRPSLELFFGFGEVGGCSRFGVVDILVRVYENGSSLVHDQLYECEAQIVSSLLIENLSATSTYDLRVRGTNEFDEGTYEYNRDGITVAAGAPTPVSAEMTPCTGLCSTP